MNSAMDKGMQRYRAFAFSFAVISFALGWGACNAQTVGLDAMSAAQDQNQAQAEAAREAQEQNEARAAELTRHRQEAAERRQNAANAAAMAEARAEKKRDQDFEDQERQILIESQEIQLQKEQTDANRENDMINSRLKAQAALTDDAQSQADATRILAQGEATSDVDRAEGAQSLMTDTGKAEVKKSGGLFGSGIGGK